MIKSFEELVTFIEEHHVQENYQAQINDIIEEAWRQDWINKTAFENLRF